MSAQLKRFVLCQPMGGFNDCLAQILTCSEYCKRWDRVLLLDTRHSSIDFMPFMRFRSQSSLTAISDYGEIDAILLEADGVGWSVFPVCLKGQLSTFRTYWLPGHGYKHVKSREDTTFDFKVEYPDMVLVHRQCGSGYKGHLILMQLEPKPILAAVIRDRMSAIVASPYIAVQVRNTDMKSDYKSLFERHRDTLSSAQRIFLATDDPGCVEWFRTQRDDVMTTSRLPEGNTGRSLHLEKTISPRIKVTDLLVDLLLLSQSTGIIADSKSGYLRLARAMHACADDWKDWIME